METKVISEKLVKVTSIDCFRAESGKRKINMPYWVDVNDALVFAFIGSHTELDQLQWQIEEGKVWVRECDGGEVE
jgi:hypothetical protein